TGSADEDVITVAAVDDVVAGTTHDHVVALPAAQNVVAAQAVDDVVAAEPDDDVRPVRAAEDVAPLGADDRRLVPAAGQRSALTRSGGDADEERVVVAGPVHRAGLEDLAGEVVEPRVLGQYGFIGVDAPHVRAGHPLRGRG